MTAGTLAFDWYPYPFIDVGEHGYGVVLLNALGISAFLVGLAFLAFGVDRRLSKDRSTNAAPV